MSIRGAQTRERIKKKSLALFSQKGFKEVTMKDICEITGLSRGGLYCHYSSTGQIFREIIDDLMGLQENEFRAKIKIGKSAADILDDVLDRYEAEMTDSSSCLSLAIYEYFSSPEAASGENPISLQYQRSVDMWTELIQYGMDRGEFRQVDIPAVCDLLLFSYQGVRLYSQIAPTVRSIPSRVTGEIRKILVRDQIGAQAEKAGTALINPADVIPGIPGFPRVCITTFSQDMIVQFVRENPVRVIASLKTANGELPVYEVSAGGKKAALFLSRVGAPACAVGLEEVIAMGAEKIVLFGSCGSLDEARTKDRIILPSSVLRDEGTSFHYCPPSPELTTPDHSLTFMKKILAELQIPSVTGKIWTTDAIYRELDSQVAQMRSQGCLAVEMEYAAALAVSIFRGAELYPFFYSLDSFDGDIWQMNDLPEYGIKSCGKFFRIALACAGHLASEQP